MPMDVLTPIITLGVVGLAWAGKLALEKWISSKVDSGFNERLASHKHSLELVTEQARYQYQKDLATFNLMMDRHFAAVDAVFQKVRIAHGAVGGLFGMQRMLTFEGFSEADLDAFLDERGVPLGKRDEITSLWANDRKQAIDCAHKYLAQLQVAEAARDFQQAKNEAYLKELYLSDTAVKALDELFEALRDWVFVAQHPEMGLKLKRSREDINAALEGVREALRRDLQGAGTAQSRHNLQDDDLP